jgi:hypothetical protein
MKASHLLGGLAMLGGAAMLAGAQPAAAGVSVGVGIGVPGPAFYGEYRIRSGPCSHPRFAYYHPFRCGYPRWTRPVFIDGVWVREPTYYRIYGGRRYFWWHGGWREGHGDWDDRWWRVHRRDFDRDRDRFGRDRDRDRDMDRDRDRDRDHDMDRDRDRDRDHDMDRDRDRDHDMDRDRDRDRDHDHDADHDHDHG